MISRRRMLAGSLMAGLYGIAAPAANAAGTVPWRNWSGALVANPAAGLEPVPLNHEDVLNAGRQQEDALRRLIEEIVRLWQEDDDSPFK